MGTGVMPGVMPVSNMALPLLTDLYQFTMAYGYWRGGRHRDRAEFELFFREAPFGGEFALFFGLRECVRFLRDFRFSPEDISFLKATMPGSPDEGFFRYLSTVTAEEVTVSAFPEGSVVFAREPLMKVRGPLLVVQLLETTLLCLVNYASLVGTNASRFRLAAGPDKKLLEMGLRRAQGPDGGLSASRYCYLGGFDSTSNVLAGKLYGIPVAGTVAHSYVASFSSVADVRHGSLRPLNGDDRGGDFVELSERCLGENFLVVLDTYSVMRSGVPNFCAVARALHHYGYQAVGVRLDSGNLARQSVEIREIFHKCAESFAVPPFKDLTIAVSNNISESSLRLLCSEKNEINVIGVGTHLVTCPQQPSLGCVYKLVQVNESPCMKLSEDTEKATIPGSKAIYRLFGHNDHPILDLLACEDEPPPETGIELECHKLGGNGETERVAPVKAELMHSVCFDGKEKDGKTFPSLMQIRDLAQKSVAKLSPEQRDLDEPKPYRVAVTEKLHALLTQLRGTSPLQ
uniref:Nicotinate phosphoribosyltransferase n=1 Tax=Xenopus tropicalis TaxID=8364 RepID=A0A7D9NJU5_XENTR